MSAPIKQLPRWRVTNKHGVTDKIVEAANRDLALAEARARWPQPGLRVTSVVSEQSETPLDRVRVARRAPRRPA